ncbi:SDR family NAD(P)-dependent oxidoreductase [Bacteroidota bacterium]
MIIITGASKGIGEFLFGEFNKENQKVIGTYNTSLPPEEYSANFYKLDISDNHSITNFIEGIRDKLINVILVNNAGITYNAFAHKSEILSWEKVINVNLIGTFRVISAILPFMREQQFGRIINISSVVAQLGAIGTSAYAASKSGLWGLSKSIAKENANKNITINNLNLGYMDAGMIKEVPEDMKNNLLENIPFGSLGDTSEIFNAIKFLIESDYITGTSIDINGGLY